MAEGMDVVEAKICLLGVNSNSYMDAVCVYIAVVFSHPVYCLQCWYLFECFEAGARPDSVYYISHVPLRCYGVHAI